MLDKSIDGALLSLRKQIIRDGGDWLNHVDALLVLRQISPPKPCRLHRKTFARDEMRQIIIKALSNGPKTGGDIVTFAQVKRPDLPRALIQARLSVKQTKLKHKGYIGGDMPEQNEWEKMAANLLKSKLKRKRVTYAQLVEKLDAIGISEKEVNVANKLSRGKFSAAFMLQCLTVIEVQDLRL